MEDNLTNGISSILIQAINREWETVSFYKDVIVNTSDNESFVSIVNDIIETCHINIGKLEAMLNSLDGSSDAVEDGKSEAEDIIDGEDTDNVGTVVVESISESQTSSWRDWNVGDKVRWSTNDFDGKVNVVGEVTDKEDDHLIVSADGMKLWVDDDTASSFHKESSMKIKESIEQGNNIDTIDDVETVVDEPTGHAINTHKRMKKDIEKKLSDAGDSKFDRRKAFLGQKNPIVDKKIVEKLVLDESALTDIEEDFVLR